MTMPHILKISPHLTARTIKQMQGLLGTGSMKITIITKPRFRHLLANFEAHPHVHIITHKFRHNYISRFLFRKFLRPLLTGVDLIHCHNEPNYHVVDAIDVVKHKIPVIYDIHDMTSCRTGTINSNEKFAYLHSDAIIHVSEEFIGIGEKYYGQQNCHALYSSSSQDNIISDSKAPINYDEIHFVYQGGIFDPTWNGKDRFRYRNYHPIFESILKEGHHIHLFTSVSEADLPSYKALMNKYPRFHFHGHLDYVELVHKMNTYDIGLAGFNFDQLIPTSIEYLNGAVGNKLFDYLCSGLPVIVTSANAMGKFVTDNNCGAVKDNDSTWKDTAQNITPGDYTQVAHKFSAEAQSRELFEIYKSLIKDKVQ